MANENEPAPAGTDDAALFNEVVTTAPVEHPIEPEKPAPETTTQQQQEAAVPSGRFREEAEARRKAESERDDLRRRLDEAYSRQAPPPQKTDPPKRSDMFEAPSAFVQEEVKPLLDPVTQQISAIREHYSLQNAITRHGDEKVSAARKALESGMGARDSEAWSTYNRAMNSIDPYGVIVNWHNGKEVMTTVGPDLNAFRQKLLDEAIKDPEFQKKVFDAARGQAASNGSAVNRPVVPKLPSIGKVGATTSAPESGEDNMSDEELFHAATRRRQ
jgi:hypothetical protein